MRIEHLLDQPGEVRIVTLWEVPRLGGWLDAPTASKKLREKARWLDPEPLICGGFETRRAHPGTGLRERVTFWADPA